MLTAEARARIGEQLQAAGMGLEELRQIVVGRERRRIGELEAELRLLRERSLDAREIAAKLSSAVLLTPEADLAAALGPVLGRGIRRAIEQDPTPITSALMPVLWPLIVGLLREQIQRMVQSFDHIVKRALSLDGWRWRLEALRTGQSFASVVMRHCVLYSVEEVLLIHRHSGLLLDRLGRSGDAGRDQVAGLLSAIRDFTADAWDPGRGELLRCVEFGALSIWLEESPSLLLAAVVRGAPPPSFRELLLAVQQKIQTRYGGVLQQFRGDVTPFATASDILEECLIERRQETRQPSQRSVVLVYALLAGLALGGMAMLGLGLVHQAQRQTEGQAFAEQLDKTPGVVVLSTEALRPGRLRIEALRDPLIPVEGISVPSGTTMVWHTFQSNDPRLVQERIKILLSPPASLHWRLQGQTLVLSGEAPHAWLQSVQQRDLSGLGVLHLDTAAVADSDARQFSELSRRIEQTPPDQQKGDAFYDTLVQLDRHAQLVEQRYYLQLYARSPAHRSHELRRKLARRAGQLEWQLRLRGLTTYGLVRPRVVEVQGDAGSSAVLKVIRSGEAPGGEDG